MGQIIRILTEVISKTQRPVSSLLLNRVEDLVTQNVVYITWQLIKIRSSTLTGSSRDFHAH